MGGFQMSTEVSLFQPFHFLRSGTNLLSEHRYLSSLPTYIHQLLIGRVDCYHEDGFTGGDLDQSTSSLHTHRFEFELEVFSDHNPPAPVRYPSGRNSKAVSPYSSASLLLWANIEDNIPRR